MKAFDAVFKEFSPVVYHFLLSLCGDRDLAEELTAVTFYQAYLHIGQFRGDCKLETWLCQIAKNALRKEQKRRSRFTPSDLSDRTADDDSELDALFEKEQLLQIHRLLHRMKEPYREVFMLRIFSNLSFKEIAGIFEKTESWAKVTFYRAKHKLMDEMEESL